MNASFEKRGARLVTDQGASPAHKVRLHRPKAVGVDLVVKERRLCLAPVRKGHDLRVCPTVQAHGHQYPPPLLTAPPPGSRAFGDALRDEPAHLASPGFGDCVTAHPAGSFWPCSQCSIASRCVLGAAFHSFERAFSVSSTGLSTAFEGSRPAA